MEKNTQWPLSSAGRKKGTSKTAVKENEGPSAQTIKNILNYSKALNVAKGSKGLDFIEYLSN